MLLILDGLPQIGVKSSFCDVTKHMNFFVAVALTLDAALALNQVAGPPRAVQIMECDQFVLDIGASSKLLRTAQQDAHLAGAHLCEKLLFLNIGFASWMNAT